MHLYITSRCPVIFILTRDAAIDHLLTALAEDKVMGEVFQGGVTKQSFIEAIKSVKGAKKSDSKTAEGNYDALSKYGPCQYAVLAEFVH